MGAAERELTTRIKSFFQSGAGEQALLLAGSFQAALHAHVAETVAAAFAVALAHMDRNSGEWQLATAAVSAY